METKKRVETGCIHSEYLFALPVAGVYLLYSPLHQLSALINRSALNYISQNLRKQKKASELEGILSVLQTEPDSVPHSCSGDLTNPLFLGLLPTRGCNMACRYCDFISGNHQEMSLDTVRWSVDAYLDLLQRNQQKQGEIHFFGGEPFHAPKPVQFAVEYARLMAERKGIRLHFEATTNGNYPEQLAGWISDNIHTVVLSLDGPADFQNMHRPLRDGSASSDRVNASARVFSEGDCELVIRTCVSNHNVEALPEIARWFSQSFTPTTVCFEPLSTSEFTEKNGLFAPQPLQFARRFSEAAAILSGEGIRTILSTADLSKNQSSSCPVGKDALIVNPEGAVNACYLLEEEWESRQMDMSLGRVSAEGFQINPAALERARSFSVHQKTLCENCFCRFSCAGGCHVHHHTNRNAGEYDDQCLRTRLVTASILLGGLGQSALREEWLADEDLSMKSVLQVSDRIAFSEEAI